MSAPFHFPSEYGRIGNWPGSIGPNQAQALFVEAMTHKKGAKFVELGFDGGRTTVVLNWAARDIEDSHIYCLAVANDETGLWFRRTQILHKLKASGHESLEPFACDMLVLNSSASLAMPVVNDWLRATASGAVVVRLGNHEEIGKDFTESLRAPGVTIWRKNAVIPSHVFNKAIDNVVASIKSVDKNPNFKVRSLHKRDERHRNTDGTGAELHAPVDADQGSKLLSS